MHSPNITAKAAAGFSVDYQLSVIDSRTGETVKTYPKAKNLILDAGLDAIATCLTPAEFLKYCAIGTGTRANKRDSGSLTFTVLASGAVSCSGSFFEAQDVGRLLKLDSGEEYYISTYTDGQNATVSSPPASDLTASEGTIWYVNETGLETETKRTANRNANNSATFSSNAWTWASQYLHSAESGPVTYREIGWAKASTGSLFGRALLATPVSLVAGQQLQARVELTVNIAGGVNTVTEPISGTGIDGAHAIETFNNAVAGYLIADQTNAAAEGQFWPGATTSKSITVSSASNALLTAIANNETLTLSRLANKDGTWQTYTAGSFKRVLSVTFSPSEANGSIRSLFRMRYNGGDKPIFRILLDSALVKANTHKLDLGFELSWGRALTN